MMWSANRSQSQAGQAMAEACVMLGMVAALFLGIWYLGKFHDIQASAIQAARYAAWERTARPLSTFADTELEKQARARLFTLNVNEFKANDGLANGQSWSKQSDNWFDHAGTTRLINRTRDVAVTTSSAAMPGMAAGKISTATSVLASGLGSLTGGEPLPQGGVYTGQVTVRLTNLTGIPALLDNLNLTLTERSSIAAESWDASGPQQVANRVKPFAPISAVSRFNSVLRPITWALSWVEPSFSEFNPGQICPDVVPADRLRGTVLPAYGGATCY